MDLGNLTLSRRAVLLAGAGVAVAAAAVAIMGTRARSRNTEPAEGSSTEGIGSGSAAGSAPTDPAGLRRAYGPDEKALAASLSAVPWVTEGGAVGLVFTEEGFTLTDASGTTRTGAYALSDVSTRTETGEGNVTARITDFKVRTASGTFLGELQEVTGPDGGTATSLMCGAFGGSAFSADWGSL